MKAVKRKVSAVFIAFLCALFFANPFWMLEYRLQDVVYQNPRLINTNIVIIGIDEWSLAQIGQFPWSRQVWADAISILNRYEDARPAVIGIDVLFAEPSWDWYADDALVDVVSASDNIVLVSLMDTGFDFEELSLDIVITNHIESFVDLQPHAPHGLANAFRDRDGTIRNTLLRMPFDGQQFYSFSVTLAAKYTGLDVYDLIPWAPDGYIYSYISYAGLPGDFFAHSVADIFEDWFDPRSLAGAIVMIGPWAIGMMDSYAVSISLEEPMYGVEIHANVVQMILEGSFKTRVSDANAFIIVVVAIMLAMLAGELLRMRSAFVLIVAACVAYYVVSVHLLFGMGYVLPILTPLLALFSVLLYQLSYSYAMDTVEKIKMRNTFKKYVDPKLVDHLIQSGEADSDEVGRRKNIAVLFVDVRGFTPMTEAAIETPEVIVETLNKYLELTASAIFNNGGSVDKFIGDATMGLFNGFVPLDDYVFKAVKAACEMVKGATAVSVEIKEKTGIDLGFGVGIHCGEAIVGNLGPSFRKDYTAIGDVVNTAARLESSAVRGQIIVGKEVYEVVKDRVEAKFIGEINLKGKKEAMEVYEIISIK